MQQTFLISYIGFGKGMNFLRAGLNINVEAKSRLVAIERLETDVKKRFPKIANVEITSCISYAEVELIERSVSHLKNKKDGLN